MENKIFNDYGIEILKRSGKYFLRTDSGEIIISLEDALLAQKGPQFAYDIIIKYDRMELFKNV